MELINNLLTRHAQMMRAAGAAVSSVHIASLYGKCRPVLAIHWSGPAGFEPKQSKLSGITTSVWARPPDSVILLAETIPENLDKEILNCAWGTGAWDLVRFEFAPLDAGKSWRDPGCGIPNSFGRSPYLIDGDPLAVGESAGDEIMERAAHEGRIEWMFKPLALSTELMRADFGRKDRTLNADCTRAARELYQQPFVGPFRTGEIGNTHEIRLGRSPHGNRSKRVVR